MNKLLFCAALVGCACSAFADGDMVIHEAPFKSTVSRASVIAELARARANGEVMNGEHIYEVPATGTALTRVEVRAAVVTARRRGELVSDEFGFQAQMPRRAALAR
jgi:hypothetical protein